MSGTMVDRIKYDHGDLPSSRVRSAGIPNCCSVIICPGSRTPLGTAATAPSISQLSAMTGTIEGEWIGWLCRPELPNVGRNKAEMKEGSMNLRNVVIIALAVACLRAWAGNATVDVPDIPDVRFPEGQPIATGNFEPSPELLISINGAMEVFNRFPKMKVNIIGHTDSKECMGAACADLGLRRAHYVYDWLDVHGVDRVQLGTVITAGSDTPVLSNDNEDRRLSRRVSFDLLSESGKPASSKP